MRRTKAARASHRERLLKRREERANRTCGECTACSDRQCLWLRGVGEKDDRPDSTGIILTGGAGKGAIYAAPIERMGPSPTEAQYLVLRRLDDTSAGRVLYWDTGLQNPEGTGTLWVRPHSWESYETFGRRCTTADPGRFGIRAA